MESSYIEDNSIQGEGNIQDKITSIKNMSKSYEMRLRGFRWDISNNKWLPHTTSLAGKDFIDLTTGILTSYSEPANLITTKTEEEFIIQFADAFYRVNSMCASDLTIRHSKYRSLIKMFKDTLNNIGSILTGSREFMTNILSNIEEKEQQGDF